MDKPTYSDDLAMQIVPIPGTRPGYFTEGSHQGSVIRGLPSFSPQPNREDTRLSGGKLARYPRGNVIMDLSIACPSIDYGVVQMLEEMDRMDIPVMVYAGLPGNLQFMHPLNATENHLPSGASVTRSLSLGSGTTLYLPLPDAAYGYYWQPYEAGTPPLIPGIVTDNCQMTRFPLGRGYAMPPVSKNLLKMSNLNSILTTTPMPADGWRWGTSAADVWGTDSGQKASPWHDGYSYWTKSTTTVLRSYKFDIAGNTKDMRFSLMYRIDGELLVELNDSSGTLLDSLTLASGSGFYEFTFGTISGSTTDCYIDFTLSSGNYMEVACPQLINGGADFPPTSHHFLGTDTAVQGSITGSELVAEGDFGADSISNQFISANNDGVVAVGGIIQPMWDDDNVSTKCTVGQVEQNGVGDVELRFNYDGISSLRFQLRTGGTGRDTDGVTGHRKGDVYAWALYTGKRDNAAICGFYAKRLRDGATYSGSYAGGPAFIGSAWWGSTDTEGDNVGAIVGGHWIAPMNVGDVVNLVASMGDADLLDFYRRTCNRVYYIDRIEGRPDQFNRTLWNANIILTQKEEF